MKTKEEMIKEKMLQEAIVSNNIIEVKGLLELGVDLGAVYMVSNMGNYIYTKPMATALGLAISYNRPEIVKLLTEKGIKLHSADRLPALNFALAYDVPESTEIVKILIDAGADVNEMGFDNYTPLDVAIYGNRHLEIKMLLDAGADINGVKKFDRIFDQMDIETVRIIAGAGFDFDKYKGWLYRKPNHNFKPGVKDFIINLFENDEEEQKVKIRAQMRKILEQVE